MDKAFKKFVQSIFKKAGYKIERLKEEDVVPYDMNDGKFPEIYKKFKNYTLTSAERLYALYKAVQYVAEFEILGDIVECGVWKGGSSMLSAYTLLKAGKTDRKIYLYDTYKGMSEPTEKDVMLSSGYAAKKVWQKFEKKDYNEWCYVSLKKVKENMFLTGYPRENFVFVEGKVEETLPKTKPAKISLLRLDTDWYESTYCELANLFPKVSKGGVILIDDYGHWKGAREAVDDYFRENKTKILLNRIDETGVIGVKIND